MSAYIIVRHHATPVTKSKIRPRYWSIDMLAPGDVCQWTESPSVYVMALTARFMGPTWGPSGAVRTQVGPMLAP